jgi:hypothetical protein
VVQCKRPSVAILAPGRMPPCHTKKPSGKLSLPRVPSGDPPRIRTLNLLIKSQLLCQIELAGPTRMLLYTACAPLSTTSLQSALGFSPYSPDAHHPCVTGSMVM